MILKKKTEDKFLLHSYILTINLKTEIFFNITPAQCFVYGGPNLYVIYLLSLLDYVDRINTEFTYCKLLGSNKI